MFALVDCNNFYASCERVFRPDLEGKPIAVLSNNDGCIVARSKEVKEIGIEMAVPIFSVRKEIEKHQVQVFSSNYTLYGDLSRRVMNTLGELVPRLEVYSIDEAFLDLSGFDHLQEYGLKIRQTVKKWTGIPVSIGIAPTKTLAKIANHLAKNHPENQGVYVLHEPQQIKQVLEKTPISSVWGIGSNHSESLKSKSIFTAQKFIELPHTWVRKNMTVIGLRTYQELKGESCLEIEDVPPPKKMVITSLSFDKVTEDYEVIQEYVANFASRCAEKLRNQKMKANLLHLSIATNKFNPRAPQYKKTESLQFTQATHYSPEIVRVALQALKNIYKPHYRYKKANVTLTGLVPASQVQSNLFAQGSSIPQEKQQKMMETIDQINQNLGRNKLRLAVQGIDNKWRSRQEKLSPCYTTRWHELLTVK